MNHSMIARVCTGRKLSLPLLVGALLCSSYVARAQSFSGGFNFALPVSDTSTATYLPSFPRHTIGAQEFVTVTPDGHFAVSGTPLRFFGTNCVGDGAFPPTADAWYVAGRMRKMGYNLVRMHHLDNSWSTTGSLFGGLSDTRHLNATNLDRLEKFIAELKGNGIYVDMNLLVSRAFKKTDGVPDADSLDDMAKGYTYYDPILIALQKEYARQLLTHVNPYTGMSLATDPALALVEVVNENSIFSIWRRNLLKPYASGGTLPVRHQHLLDSLWGAYLHRTYASDSALAAAWTPGSVPGGQELVVNGTYEADPFPGRWTLEQYSPGSASVSRVSGNAYEGTLSAKITVSASDGTDWHVQWKETGLSVLAESTLVVHFAARADSIRKISLSVMKDVSPYTGYGGAQFTLDTLWHLYTCYVTSHETSQRNVRISFSVGAAKGTYWFDAVSMKLSGSAGLLAGESLDSIPRRIDYSECGTFTDGRVRDQTTFYLRVESDFLADMRSFLVDSLGIRVPIVGTNWNFGAPDLAVQSGLDYTDNHAYWDHPSFPSTAWSTTDWTITNTPMVTQTNGGTIGSLMSGDQVIGKPSTISEYNHPFPNRYLSEGPLFLTAYGAFNSIDGIMFFDYTSGSDWTTDMVTGYFDMYRNTAQMALMPSLATAFRKGYISPAKETVSLRFTSDDVALTPKHDDVSWAGANPVPPALPLVHSVRSETFAASSSNIGAIPSAGSPPYVADTKELRWDPTGVFSVGTPRFTAVTGLPGKMAGIVAGDMSIVSSSDHATFLWISLDDSVLANARKSLLVVATRIQNTNMVWDGTTTIHNNWGIAPTLVAPLQASFRLHLRADSIRVIPLDVHGEASGTWRTLAPSDTNLFVVALDQSVDQSPWFGIQAIGHGVRTSVDPAASVPGAFSLEQNFPNPFNPTTTLRYTVGGVVAKGSGVGSDAGHVRIAVYDLLGREAALLVDEIEAPGTYTVTFDASALASGTYFCRMQAGGFVQVRKMVVAK
jgi:hypothetical protein